MVSGVFVLCVLITLIKIQVGETCSLLESYHRPQHRRVLCRPAVSLLSRGSLQSAEQEVHGTSLHRVSVICYSSSRAGGWALLVAVIGVVALLNSQAYTAADLAGLFAESSRHLRQTWRQ